MVAWLQPLRVELTMLGVGDRSNRGTGLPGEFTFRRFASSRPRQSRSRIADNAIHSTRRPQLRFGSGRRVIHAVEGRCLGTLSDAPRGTMGFGWDAVFIPEGGTRTWAEVTQAEKDAKSHRRRAWEQLSARFGG